MVAYEIYQIHQIEPITRYEFIGVLVQKRKNPTRINGESIIHWGRKCFGRNLDINRILVIQLDIDKKSGKSLRGGPFYITHSRVSSASS
jgi:hypothetical protein